jgi:hypothetical protein
MSKTTTDLSISAPLSPALSLRQACRKTGYDDNGRRCPGCPLRELCESEERWLVRLADRSRMI